MKSRKVIDSSHLPLRWPLSSTAIAYLLLDKFHAPGWLWRALGLLFLIVWFIVGVDIFTRLEIRLKELS